MINWKEKTTTIIQKVVCFLFVCSQTTYVLAQHYSGRHVDDFDGNGSGSGGFLVLLFIAIVIGGCIYFYSIVKEKGSSSASHYTPPKKEMTIQEMYERDSRELQEKIERARKESESASCSIVAFIFFMGFFLVLGLSRSCSNENHPENSTTNNNPLNHSNGSTSPPSTEGKGEKLNDLKSIMQYINEDKQQTDNKGK